MEGLRERKTAGGQQNSQIPRVKSVVKRLDLFPKVEEDYIVQTNGGGYGLPFCSVVPVVTVVTLLLMFILLISETAAYLKEFRSDYMTIRDSSDTRFFINFNLTVPSITCRSSLLLPP